MDVIVQGKKISLTSKDFKTQGGEGLIYIKSNIVYKIYQDPARAIPENKFKELNKLSHQNVVKPQNLILNPNGNIIGYTMNFVPNSVALCQLFPKAFRDRNSITPEKIKDLILNFRQLVQTIHKDKCLIVDLNELNFLVQSGMYENIYAIDVDSYQTPSYRATAIMPSIKDRHSTTFTEDTDWFSFAILAFQLFIGIHPYKGIHPDIKSMDDRMLKNISILNKKVSIPKSCNDISVIPKNWLNWFELLFEKGTRMAPPELFESIVNFVVQQSITSGPSLFNIKLLFTMAENIEHCFYTGSDYAYILNNKTLHIGNNSDLTSKDVKAISFLKTFNSVCSIEKINETIFIQPYKSKDKIQCGINVEGMLFDRNNLYVKSDESIYLVEYIKATNSLSTIKVANVMKNSTEFFGGCVIQNMLGTKYLTYFNNKEMYNIKLSIQDKIINARKIENYLAMINVNNSGEYVYNLYYLDKTDLIKLHEATVTYNDINFAVNDTGIGFAIIDDGSGLVFNSKSVKQIQSADLSMGQRLFAVNNLINYFQGKDVYSIALK